MATRRKKVTKLERLFAQQIASGMGSTMAARKIFKVKCEPYSREAQKFKDLARSPRVEAEVDKLKKQQSKEAQVDTILKTSERPDWDNLRQFAYDRLIEIRDDPTINASSRVKAIAALERLSDPARDVNLIKRWANILWRTYEAHCPCCHENFSLAQIKNQKMAKIWKEEGEKLPKPIVAMIDRRLEAIKYGEKRKVPHVKQMEALASLERHLAGMGAARAGKSFLLALFGFLYFLLPGVEIWLLARVYDDARSEIEYIEGFLKTAFHPVYHHMVTKQEDKKSGEVSLVSRWGSELRIKSGKAAGSITGRELEAILVAEPAWVDASLFEEVRARMSSRLGRILAVGTPKGYGGFIHRMTRLSQVAGGKKIKPEDRLITHGADWGKSLMVFNIDPADNPEYVSSEKEAALTELTESEYAHEFLGEMKTEEGARFPFIMDHHLRNPRKEEIEECSFVLGIDQGEKNFAACLVGWDGEKAFVTWEYFDGTNNTIRANLLKLMKEVKPRIGVAGGDDRNWQITIFDADPPISNILDELDDEKEPWPTEMTYRPKNKKDLMNWREETYMWVNALAKHGNLVFDADNADLLHDQLAQAMRKPPPEGKETKASADKGWKVNDPWRGDHVMDAFIHAMWVLYSGGLRLPEDQQKPGTTWEEAEASRDYQRAADERRELQGFDGKEIKTSNNDLFQKHFHRPRKPNFGVGLRGYYSDES